MPVTSLSAYATLGRTYSARANSVPVEEADASEGYGLYRVDAT